MVTITTIGFGNTVPKTSAGRIFVIFYGAGGIVLFGTGHFYIALLSKVQIKSAILTFLFFSLEQKNIAMAVNAIRYVILEDLHRQFALRAKERKIKREARRRDRREERLRGKEQRKRVRETLKQLALANGASMLDPNQNSRSHLFSILPKHFTIHGSSKRLSGHFASGNGGGYGGNKSMTETTPADFPYSLFGTKSSSDQDGSKDHQVIEMTRSASSPSGDATFRKDIDDIFNEHRQSDQEVDLEKTWTTAQAKNKEKTESFSSIRRVRRHRSLIGLIFWVIRYLYRITGHACGWRGAECSSQIAEVQPTPKEQREADKRLAHEESMEEYKRRLRFSFLMFMCFWLIGAAVFRSLEGWTFGMAMYFSFVAFSTIGYGDLVPLTLAGRSIFLAYCLIGIVTLTFLASLVSELLSKTMRRHVVQTQLRRSERFLEHGDRLVQSPTERDPEQGETEDGLNELSGDDGLQEERMRTLQNLTSQATTTGDGGEGMAQTKTCQGSLRNLVQVSRDFDTLLQKVLGVDYDGGGSTSQGMDTIMTPEVAVESSSESILEYLEKGDGDDSLYLSPSISRDVTSTSSIQRHSRAKGRSYMDLRSTGTYHGTGQSSVSSSQFSITAWPTSEAAAVAGTSVPTSSSAQSRSNSPRQSQVIAPSSYTAPITTHRHNSDGTVTIAAVHWQHLIEYSRQFRVLTDSCDQTLKRLLAWEANEKKMCLKRRQTKERQQRLLRERRLRLFELGGNYGAVDDGIEDEEELDESEEEGSNYEDDETTVNNDGRGIYSADGGEGGDIQTLDDEVLDKTRENIADALLGPDRRLPSSQSQSRPEIVPLQTTTKSSTTRAAHHQRAIAERKRVIGVESLVGTRAAPGRGRSFHPPASNDQSADESSTTAVSITGNGGGIPSFSHPGARAARMTAHDRETGSAVRRRSRSRSHQRSHASHSDGGNVGHAVRATLQRPPLHTIHTNVACSSEDGGEVIGEDP